MHRANILLIHSDQHRYDTVGCHGHPLVRTPHLDRLALEGTDFSHAFTPCPICTPARACQQTGLWPTQHGSIGIPSMEPSRAARPHLPVVSQLIKNKGYATAMVGKFHNELEGGPTDHGFDHYIGTWPYKKWREEQGLPPEPTRNGLFGEVDEGCSPEQSCLAWQADHVIGHLETYHTQGKAFFLRWDPPEPHLPCKPNKVYADSYPSEAVAPWPSFSDPLENKPSVQARQRKIWGVENWTWKDWAPVAARYLAIIEEMDHHIGRILSKLEELGLSENTLIIYSSDHGDYCGAHGQIDKHFAMYDDLTRVPLIMRWPGKVRTGETCDAFVSNELDIAATLLEATGVPQPDLFEGVSLLSQTKGDSKRRETIFSQYFGTESGLYSQRMVRDYRYKYVFNPTSIDEFYDLETDPVEFVNRIDDPMLKNEIQRMRIKLTEWMAGIKDPLLNRWTRHFLLGEPSEANRMS